MNILLLAYGPKACLPALRSYSVALLPGAYRQGKQFMCSPSGIDEVELNRIERLSSYLIVMLQIINQLILNFNMYGGNRLTGVCS